MSSHIVEICEVDDVQPHPNADRLDIVRVKGWQCVVGKGEYRKSDKVIYIPIDSVLPENVESILFPPDSKVKLHNHRIKTIKLRGAISQGMAVKPETLAVCGEVGYDVGGVLGITKYEPPPPKEPGFRGRQTSPKQCNPYFHKYTDIENIKNYNSVFEPGEIVVVTEKIHGTNFRCGWVKSVPNTWWKKVKKFFGWLPEWEFVYGSRNVQLQDRGSGATTFYEENVYAEAVKKYRLKEVLDKGYVLYGEIYGDGIQKGYTYGCGKGERKLAVFDVQIQSHLNPNSQLYLDSAQLGQFVLDTKLPSVPIIYVGEYDEARIKSMAVGESVVAPSQKIREGVVIRPLHEAVSICGRKILKLINDDYLLKADTTENH
jgi:RNA ligase (TIGR02306 family)